MEKSRDALRTISEVAAWLGVPTHVLRFWESRFSQIRPIKRAGGRRYYRPNDRALLGGIKKLLHDDGLTIRGVQTILREQGVSAVAALAPASEASAGEAEPTVASAELKESAESQLATDHESLPDVSADERVSGSEESQNPPEPAEALPKTSEDEDTESEAEDGDSKLDSLQGLHDRLVALRERMDTADD